MTYREHMFRHEQQELGRAEMRERFRSHCAVEPALNDMNRWWTEPLLPQWRLQAKTISEFWAERDAQEREIEAAEQLKNRNGVPPLPITRVHLFK